MNYEAWIWTELLAFDNRQDDQGVAEYIRKTGFVPKGICLLVSAPDFVLLHNGMEKEVMLPPDVCSRDGHKGNEERLRQNWTSFQVKSLVDHLHRAGSEVYISMFTAYHRNKFHQEWISAHPEVLQVWDFQGAGLNINCLARLNDGTFFEDVFISKVIRTVLDYGFDGWHGPDGWGPLTTGSLAYTDCSDDMMAQFADHLCQDLPEVVVCKSNNQVSILEKRMDWIWQNRRREWLHFNIARMETFWRKMVKALHDNGKKAIINSAWTKACFEAIYRYGIDYRRIAATGVDYMVVETVAAGLTLIHGRRDQHYDFLAMLMEIKACVPGMKLLFLHGIKDAVENYDLLRHAPARLEKELYSLANVCYHDGENTHRAADGFLACLGDGISADEWRWLKTRWDKAFSAQPGYAGSVTAIWSERAFYSHFDDYLETGGWCSHRQTFFLMEHGVQIQSAARIENIGRLTGTLLVPYFHLLPEEELQSVLNYRGGAVILLGDLTRRKLPCADVAIDYGTISCVIINSGMAQMSMAIPAVEGKFTDEEIPLAFYDDIKYRDIPSVFWNKVADIINSIIVPGDRTHVLCRILDPNGETAVMSLEFASDALHIAVKNNSQIYAKPELELTKNIRSIKILSGFPLTECIPDKDRFKVVIPPQGIVVMEIKTE